MRIFILTILFFSTLHSFAQRVDNLYSKDLRWRNVGPANMMGRIADIDALNTDYRQVICASASGGVFQSKNGGVSWEPIFDRYGTSSIGSVALFQGNPSIIWVGTGESANRNSSGWGDGLYLSNDGGLSFSKLGLSNTHHIADIALHPTNPDIAYVAAVGHLWGYSGDRGLFFTDDRGKSWKKLDQGLPVDSLTGCTEVVMDPSNPNILYAGFYHRLRRPYIFKSGGGNGGIYKSTDAGKSWKKLVNGLPTGETGQIDLSICKSFPSIIVASVEADENIPDGQPGSGTYRSDDGGNTWRFLLKHNMRPYYHGQIEIDPIDPQSIYLVSRDFRISRDGGKTFTEREWRTDGGDDHAMWIAPYDSKIIYMGTDQGLRLTVDGGESVLSFNNMAIGQYYAIGVDMRDPYWIGGGLQDNGLWMGPSNSREVRGILNEHNTWVGEGDGFHFQMDPTDWKTIYMVNHVGFAARLNVETRKYSYITPTPQTISNYSAYFDPNYKDYPIKYSIDPGEHWFFYENTDRVKLPPQFRFNWSSPLVLSSRNVNTLYFGGNHLFKSMDKGNSWKIISPDLTTNDPEFRNPSNSGYLTRSVTGGENHFTIITLAESSLDTQEIWAGTDDGNLQVTLNGGKTWTEVGQLLVKQFPFIGQNASSPRGKRPWVSRVSPSAHVKGRCYVSLDNHRYDDMNAYVFVTDDYGKTWKSLQTNLPEYSVYVVREDPENPDLLFVGTEQGVLFSYNQGQEWHELMGNMPTVAVYDLVIHPRDGDLIAGTHGRSIWILDDISPLRQLSGQITNKPFHLFQSRRATRWLRINTGRKQPYFEFRGQNPRSGAAIHLWINKSNQTDSVSLNLVSENDNQLKRQWKIPVQPGINRIYWDMQVDEPEISWTQEIENMRIALEKLSSLSSLSTAAKDSLTQFKASLKALSPQNKAGYETLRRQIHSVFGVYGIVLGKELKLKRQATAGNYQLEVKAGTFSETKKITIREDPLLNK
jgi:photosystem II stability/assembly factor-like uncharacterized protein